jgi:sugar lactone lactonase YvrE
MLQIISEETKSRHHQPEETGRPTIKKEVAIQTPKMPPYDASQVAEKSDKQQGSPISYTSKHEDISQAKEEDTAPAPVGEKYKEYYPPSVEGRSKPKNLKLLIPIIIVAVVGSIVGFAFLSTTTTTPPETTTTTPPETTTTTPPETTTTTPPETTTTTPPETTTTTPPEYSFFRAWGSYGSSDGQFDMSAGGDVVIDSSDKVYVADSYNDRIQVFDKNGAFLTSIGSYGSGAGKLINATDVAIDSSGNVYVTDTGNNRIQKFDSNGDYITSWGSYGSYNGQFDFPGSVTVDDSGYVYVADTGNSRIQKFDSNGDYITSWGSYGSGNGQFDWPLVGSVDPQGYVYVADTGNNRIEVFAPTE